MREDSFPLAREETVAREVAWLVPGLKAGIWHCGRSTVPPFLVREKKPPPPSPARPEATEVTHHKNEEKKGVCNTSSSNRHPHRLCAATPGKAPPWESPPRESPPYFPRSLWVYVDKALVLILTGCRMSRPVPGTQGLHAGSANE